MSVPLISMEMLTPTQKKSMTGCLRWEICYHWEVHVSQLTVFWCRCRRSNGPWLSVAGRNAATRSPNSICRCWHLGDWRRYQWRNGQWRSVIGRPTAEIRAAIWLVERHSLLHRWRCWCQRRKDQWRDVAGISAASACWILTRRRMQIRR